MLQCFPGMAVFQIYYVSSHINQTKAVKYDWPKKCRTHSAGGGH